MHHATRTTISRQSARISAHHTQCDTFSFFNLLTSDALLDTVERLLPAHRERLYPPTETLSMFLAQALSAIVPARTLLINPPFSGWQVGCPSAAPVLEPTAWLDSDCRLIWCPASPSTWAN